jgi:divalent metal cation (Fe/Co/Zn/Cd) transporter
MPFAHLTSRPEEHHYGHGKVESVSALTETALLCALSGIVIWESVQRLIGAHNCAVELTPWAFAVIIAWGRCDCTFLPSNGSSGMPSRDPRPA